MMNFGVSDFDKFLSPLIISPDDERDISAKDTVGSNKSFSGYTFHPNQFKPVLTRFEPPFNQFDDFFQFISKGSKMSRNSYTSDLVSFVIDR